MAPSRHLGPPPPTFWNVIGVTLRGWMGRRRSATPRSAWRDTVILDATVAVRGKRYEEAAELLNDRYAELSIDPACLNLLGVICEARGDFRSARRFYGMAMSLDARFAPARHNMGRLYELSTFGRTAKAILLGDAEIRATRRLDVTLMNRRCLLIPF